MLNSPIYERITRFLDKRRQQGQLRVCAEPAAAEVIDLSSNSYLALHKNAKVTQTAARLTAGSYQGNGASRLIASASPLFSQLEAELAAWNHAPAALVFGSGYGANLGIIQALCNRDTEVFSDRLNHASILDGIILSRARLQRYQHGDMKDLKRLLAASASSERIIITESVFSMDGDCAPLADISELAATYGCMLMVDEAHATGLWGENNSGLIEACGVRASVDVHMGTLSKSVAGLGGFAIVNTLLRSYLVNQAHSFIYSTALPHAVLAWDLAAVQYLRQPCGAGKDLLHVAQEFREQMQRLGFSTGTSTTQIVPCMTSSNEKAIHLAAFLAEHGIKAPAIRSPTVPAGSERVRLSLHTEFDQAQQQRVLDVLKKWKKAYG